MKNCPKCYTRHDAQVAECDCGYVFKDVKVTAMKAPKVCPFCKHKGVIVILNTVKRTFTSLVVKAERTYRCPECEKLYTREGYEFFLLPLIQDLIFFIYTKNESKK